jgi:hypothetical protein
LMQQRAASSKRRDAAPSSCDARSASTSGR